MHMFMQTCYVYISLRSWFDTLRRHVRWLMRSPSQTGEFPPGTPVFLPHEDHMNANIDANEHELYKSYNLFRNCCKINKV